MRTICEIIEIARKFTLQDLVQVQFFFKKQKQMLCKSNKELFKERVLHFFCQFIIKKHTSKKKSSLKTETMLFVLSVRISIPKTSVSY